MAKSPNTNINAVSVANVEDARKPHVQNVNATGDTFEDTINMVVAQSVDVNHVVQLGAHVVAAMEKSQNISTNAESAVNADNVDRLNAQNVDAGGARSENTTNMAASENVNANLVNQLNARKSVNTVTSRCSNIDVVELVDAVNVDQRAVHDVANMDISRNITSTTVEYDVNVTNQTANTRRRLGQVVPVFHDTISTRELRIVRSSTGAE